MFKALLCHPVKDSGQANDDTKDVWKTGAASNCLAWRSAAGVPRSVPSQGLQPWRNLPLRRPPLKQPCVYRRARALSRTMEESDLSQTLPGRRIKLLVLAHLSGWKDDRQQGVRH